MKKCKCGSDAGVGGCCEACTRMAADAFWAFIDGEISLSQFMEVFDD